jgi:hypothetical protein
MFALGVAAVLAPAARAAPAGTKTVVVSVGPGPGSELEADDAEVTAVRSSLTALLRQDPSCSAGKVGDVLEDSFASVEEHRSDVQYIWYYINGQWVHRWELLTEFEVDFGSGRTVLVSVEESEPKPI